jgi:hypothetical protein
MSAAVSLVLAADEPAPRRVAEALFPETARRFLSRSELCPRTPFAGPLFDVLGALPAGSSVGLVVPVLVLDVATGAVSSAGAHAGPGTRDPSVLLAVADHVNLVLRGPLTGRWPAAVPRTFPALTHIYQPAVVRAFGGARVYSSGVVVAGVTDAGRLSPFEARAVRDGGFFAVSDTLVPAAIVAAYFGLRLAACGVPWAPARDRE